MSNNYINILLETKQIVDSFKGKSAMLDFVQERLDASLKMYTDSLKEECDLILKLKPKSATRKLKTIK